MRKEYFVPKLKKSPEKPKEETEEEVGYVPLEPGQKEVEIEGVTEKEIEKVKKDAAPSEEEKREAKKEK